LRERLPELASLSVTGTRVPWLIERRGTSSHHLFTIHAPLGQRDALLASLGRSGIGTAVNYRALHDLTYFADTLRIRRGTLPVSEEIGDRTISLPLYPTLTAEEQQSVVEAVAHGWPNPAGA
jgi:UDP-4-amino-4-deoxy-L-arabinose-oxoglutarate aminotransferase